MLPPAKHTFDTIWGHEAARRMVPRLLGAGRLPHAILLTGPGSIGKRSLAFAMAKAILSAGRPAPQATITAPGPAMNRRPVDEPGDGDDLFGAAAEPDLFGAAAPEEPDLFGNPEPAAPPPPARSPGAKKPAAAPAPARAPAQAPPRPPLSQRGSRMVERRDFRGFDPRVSRLVEGAYPTGYDLSGRPEKLGHVDLTIVEPPEGRRSILVDQIRYLQDIAPVSPIEGAFRVVLIFGADTITQEAGNSILKLLEEPPRHLVMILVADRLAQVLPTIKSRCAVVPMAPMEREALVRALVEKEGLASDLARVAAVLAECRPGVALTVLESQLLQRRRDLFEARLQVDRYGPPAVAAAVARIGTRGNLEEALWLLLSFARDRLVHRFAGQHPELLVHGDVADLLAAVPAEPTLLDEEADRLLEAYRQLAHPFTPNQRVVLQQALWP